MIALLGIIALLLIAGWIYNPSLEYTRNGDLILWYDKDEKREYKIIY